MATRCNVQLGAHTWRGCTMFRHEEGGALRAVGTQVGSLQALSMNVAPRAAKEAAEGGENTLQAVMRFLSYSMFVLKD